MSWEKIDIKSSIKWKTCEGLNEFTDGDNRNTKQ